MSINPTGGPRPQYQPAMEEKFDKFISSALIVFSRRIHAEADRHVNEKPNKKLIEFRVDDNESDIHSSYKVDKDQLLTKRNIDNEIESLPEAHKRMYRKILDYVPASGYERFFHVFDPGLEQIEGTTNMTSSKLFKMALLDIYKKSMDLN